MINNQRMMYLIISALFFIIAVISLSEATHTNTATIETNIYATAVAQPIIRVEVPDLISLGNATKGSTSNEIKVYVNNTGNVDITVTPQLLDSSDLIYNNLYFRSTKTRTINGTSISVPFERIGDFSFNISKPVGSAAFNYEYFYMVLDLMNYTGNITQNLLSYRTNVTFLAVQQ